MKVNRTSFILGIVSLIILGLSILDLIVYVASGFSYTLVGIISGSPLILVAFLVAYGYNSYKVLKKKQNLSKTEYAAFAIVLIFTIVTLVLNNSFAYA